VQYDMREEGRRTGRVEQLHEITSSGSSSAKSRISFSAHPGELVNDCWWTLLQLTDVVDHGGPLPAVGSRPIARHAGRATEPPWPEAGVSAHSGDGRSRGRTWSTRRIPSTVAYAERGRPSCRRV